MFVEYIENENVEERISKLQIEHFVEDQSLDLDMYSHRCYLKWRNRHHIFFTKSSKRISKIPVSESRRGSLWFAVDDNSDVVGGCK